VSLDALRSNSRMKMFRPGTKYPSRGQRSPTSRGFVEPRAFTTGLMHAAQAPWHGTAARDGHGLGAEPEQSSAASWA
jgi:hypothetical protein